jgi:hypothetical protein
MVTDSIDGGAWTFTVGRSDLKLLDTVKAYSIPEILEQAMTDRIDILKLDIEGTEKELFSGATNWLDRVSIIVIELHDRYEPGCSKAMYRKLIERQFHQEIRGENIFIRLET